MSAGARPRLVVRIEWGRLRGRRALVSPGQTIRVGRLERADLVVPDDEELSGLHFELTWDGERCAARDLQSANGTFFEGEPRAEAELRHRSWIRAGNTFFTIFVEGRTPPRTRGPRESPASAERKQAALAALRAEEAPLFAVMDAARDDWILHVVNASAEEVASLYEGVEGEELHDVAPYLFALPPGSWALEALVREGWGLGWGIYLTCRRPFKEVRRHLRRLLVVDEKETGEPLYFRFYDPKVLPVVLPVCKPRQMQEIFGEIEAYLMESEGADVVRLPSPGPHR